MGAIIYLVDSDKSSLRGLSRLLSASGFQVNAYASYYELLKYPIKSKNACIILDAQIVNDSYLELRNAFEKKSINLPIIFISAEEARDIRKKAQTFRTEGFFRKPVDGYALIDTITWTLETQKE